MAISAEYVSGFAAFIGNGDVSIWVKKFSSEMKNHKQTIKETKEQEAQRPHRTPEKKFHIIKRIRWLEEEKTHYLF